MNEPVSDIKPAEIYSDLSDEDISEMMAEAAKIDALFQAGRISTLYPTDTLTLKRAGAGADVPAPVA
jgi:hypothetical protein